jgi:hypothetical protein
MATVATASNRQMTMESFLDTVGSAAAGVGLGRPGAPVAGGAFRLFMRYFC